MSEYLDQLRATLDGVVDQLTAKGIEPRYLEFGGEGKEPSKKPRIPTDANSEFLANRAMGDWAEKALAKAIDNTNKNGKAIAYGNSDKMAAGEASFKEFYLAGLRETRLYGKRPDLLLFNADANVPNLSNFPHSDAAPFVKSASAAIEVRSSKYEALKYLHLRKIQRDAGNKTGRETPSFTVKVEDLIIVYRWLEQNLVPQTYCQVFFDSVYAINFLDIFRIIAAGGKSSKLEKNSKSQNKATIMIPITLGVLVGTAKALPSFAAEQRVTKLGRHDAYVVPCGGGFVLDANKMRQVLLPR